MMDDNFSNLLDGARQYFQGLPKASPNGGQEQQQPPSGESAVAQPDRPQQQPSLTTSSSPSPQPRQPSEPPDLTEPEPHIIYKAAAMQQPQQPLVNQDAERPSSANMISPPTHIIHKPQPEETRPKEYQPVLQNKYSSHLPTPPQPSIHTSAHYQERFGTQRQQGLTVLQSRQARPYPPRTYAELQPTSASKVSLATSSYVQQRPYEGSMAVEQRRGSVSSEMYLKASQAPQKQPEAQPSYGRPFSYQHHELEKAPASGNGGLKAYAQSIQQKMRQIPVSKSPSVEPSRQQQQQLAYVQKYPQQQPQTSSYSHPSGSTASYSMLRNSHQDMAVSQQQQQQHMKVSNHTSYEYPSRMVLKPQPGEVRPAGYPERLPSHMDQRQMMPNQVARVPTSEYASQYSRISNQKIPADYQQHAQLKSHQSSSQSYSANPSNQYNHTDPSASGAKTSSGSYYVQNSYSGSTSVVKHSYDISPKHNPTSRTMVTKQNTTSVHQQRMTVSVTSLVNQMKQMAPMPAKPRKESPLDLSVKTVRIPADSTAQDDTETLVYEKREINSHHSGVNNIREAPSLHGNLVNNRHRMPPKPNNISSSHKVDFLPNFNTNSAEKAPQYRESNQIYAQNKKYLGYDSNQPRANSSTSVPQGYLIKPPHIDQQSFSSRYDSKQMYAASQEYSQRRIDTHLPKIDLTIPENDHHERRSAQVVHVKEDNRKREMSMHPNPVPHKVSRYDGWSYEKHARPEVAYSREAPGVPLNNYKVVNGNSYPSVHHSKHYDNNIYKKSENVDPYSSKYHMVHYQHGAVRPEQYYSGYPKPATGTQNYEYHNSDKSISLLKHDGHHGPSYHGQYSTPPADKRVLSILRNSLEARNMPENQRIVDNSDDCIIIPSDDNNSMHALEVNEFRMRKVKSLENKIPKSPPPSVSFDNSSFKVHVPKAVDSIKYELDSPSKSIRIRDDLKTSHDSSKTDLSDLSNDRSLSSDNELAARIRTKAERKGFIQLNQISKSLEAIKGTIAMREKMAEENKSVPHRRRLFSKSDKDGVQLENKALSVIRSSSDSVFDFQDSGSEFELLAPMKTAENKSDTSKAIEPHIHIKQERNAEDDFWTEACDSFLEQLKTGKVKRTRRKKTATTNDKTASIKDNLDVVKLEKMAVLSVVDIKKEYPLTCIKQEYKSTENFSSDSSDEDQPLINKKVKKDRLTMLKNNLTNSEKSNSKCVSKSETKTDSFTKRKNKAKTMQDSKTKTRLSSDDEQLTLLQIKQEKKREFVTETSDNESDDVLASSRKMRKGGSSSKSCENKAKSPTKDCCKIKDENSLKKPGFGDGSDFRPGWEEEVYKYKRSLRMPASLINVSRPPHWPRISTSLPDLDPCPNSPAPSSTTEEIFTQKNHDKLKNEVDSDAESTSSFYNNRKANYDSEASCSTIISTGSKKVKHDNNSIVDVLIKKCGKKDTKKNKAKKDDMSGPKLIPRAENSLELLPTPTIDLDNNDKKGAKSGSKGKGGQHLISFRRETVSNFRDAFINTDSRLGATQEFSPVVFNSRTRKETRVMKKRATIKEVFGDERPASAPPTSCREDVSPLEDRSMEEIKLDDTKTLESKLKKKKHLISMMREGLRSSGPLKKGNANGRQMRFTKRHNHLKNSADVKLKNSLNPAVKLKKEPFPVLDNNKKVNEPIPLLDNNKEVKESPPVSDNNKEVKSPEQENPESEAKEEAKKFRRLFVRKKMSSGFDYIRKKKKQLKKDDTVVKKRSALPKPTPESVNDIQKEIKGWIVGKSTGETALHKAVRHGYTDCVAYILEKMNLSPSVRDNAGFTPLHEASSRGHLDIARLLLQYGADVSEAAQGGIRPLHDACENGHIEIMRLLLSYGADPLLATYSGQTPMSHCSGKAARFLQLHINDVVGNISQPWRFSPCKLLDPVENGYDPLANPPGSPPTPPPPSPIEFITSTSPLPPLYKLKPPNNATATAATTTSAVTDPPDSGYWCLLQDLASLLQVKSRDALLKQIHCGPGPPRDSLKELRMQEFLDRAQCQQLMSAGEKINIRASKIALVRYTEKVKQLLNIDTVSIR